MKNCAQFFIIFVFSAVFIRRTLNFYQTYSLRRHFTAVHKSLHAEQLYTQLRQGVLLSLEIVEDPRMRQDLCEEITGSDYFDERNQDAVDMDSIRRMLKKKHKNVYRLIYRKNQSILRRGSTYKNPYVVRQFKVSALVGSEYRTVTLPEYVFVCITSGSHVDDITAYYVSQEYNVSGARNSSTMYIAGRFIFSYFTGKFEALAEEPSQARIHPQFNVELHYLRLRKIYQPVPISESTLDPLCRLTIHHGISPFNQWNRLCATVLGSLYFRTKIKYPKPAENQDPCLYVEVSFQTEDAIRETQTTVLRYYEWMVMCEARQIASDAEVQFLISRAYASNQVFVYSPDNHHQAVYLENLSTNVSVIDTAPSDR